MTAICQRATLYEHTHYKITFQYRGAGTTRLHFANKYATILHMTPTTYRCNIDFPGINYDRHLMTCCRTCLKHTIAQSIKRQKNTLVIVDTENNRKIVSRMLKLE